jgi:hypothetical protein
MAHPGSSISRRVADAFLTDRDLARIREMAEEVDAAFGAALDALRPVRLAIAGARGRAA